ncbi:MAG TPA: hypothetical protein VH189_10800 [Rhizomicrobium sp.]|nr:hypothetical protein [Rhizomicrobium sp.]
MKKILVLAVLAGLALAAPAHAANICIDTRKIDSSKSTDGRIMVFKMKDGTTLVNHLKGICPDLKFNGFAWRTHSGDNQVCENEDSFQVLQSMQVCVLGKFDAAAKSAPNLDEHAER